MERLQQDSATSLHEHQKNVMGALAQAKQETCTPATPAATASKDDSLLLMKMAMSAFAGPLVGAAVAVAATALSESSSAPKKNSLFVGGGGGKKSANSLFVGGGSTVSKTSKADHKTTSVMPISYSDRKAATAKNHDIAARCNIASMSLTGSSAGHGHAAPIKGITAKPGPGLETLKQELAIVKEAIEKPYVGGIKRLAADLARGVDDAERQAGQKPDMLKNTSPTFQAQMQAKTLS